jgi:paraquat-inducible protein B
MEAKPEVTRGKKLTAIWIIPLVAVGLGIWMVAYTYLNEGPEIEITFKTAVGLEAGKTKVKFRNVDVGMVQTISLSSDMKNTIAMVKLERAALPMLGEDTRFWVVRARIGGGSVSGLDTLLSGAYIEVGPATSQSELRKFVALEQPPLTPIGAPGLGLTLLSERSASVGSGDPVLFNGFKVGRVESMTFDPDSKLIQYRVFIDAPYHQLVNSSVRFWDVSGISLIADASGIALTTGSLESILLGGVTFGTAPDLEPGSPVENNTEFRLYPSYKAILDSPFANRLYYVVEFDQSLRGLLAGAPVEYRGIQVGKVERILVKELMTVALEDRINAETHPLPVLIYVEPGRLDMPDTMGSLDTLRKTIKASVAKGMRATLSTGNLLSGAQIVDFEFFDDVPAAELGEFDGYPTIPSVETGIGQLEHRISTLLAKLNRLPLEEMVNSVNLALAELTRSLTSARSILDDADTRAVPGEMQASLKALRALLEADSTRAVPEELQASLMSLRYILEHESTRNLSTELESTLAATRDQLEGRSPEAYQLGLTLKEVESAARALREFLDYLEKNPEGLLQGKSKMNK